MISQELLNIISLITGIVSLITGIASIILAVLAILLSFYLDRKSSAALNAIEMLVAKIETLSQANLTQQTTTSSKLIDGQTAVINKALDMASRNPYGPNDSPSNSTSALADVMKQRLDGLSRQLNVVEQSISSIGTSNNAEQIKTAMKPLRSELGELSNQLSSNVDPLAPIRGKLIEWLKYPANFVLLAAIIKENANSIASMKTVEAKYNFLGGWESAVDRLFEIGILSGSTESFRVEPTYQTSLAALIDKNWSAIHKLVEFYQLPENRNGQTREELIIAQELMI